MCERMTVSQILPVGTQRAFSQGRAGFLVQTLVPLERLMRELLVVRLLALKLRWIGSPHVRGLGIVVRGLWYVYLHTCLLYILCILFVTRELA